MIWWQVRDNRNNAGHKSASSNREAAQLGFTMPVAALVPEALTAKLDPETLYVWRHTDDDCESLLTEARASHGAFHD